MNICSKCGSYDSLVLKEYSELCRLKTLDGCLIQEIENDFVTDERIICKSCYAEFESVYDAYTRTFSAGKIKKEG